ncbi:MAG: SPOR domain-containing protein [Burkholderiaceae bacterium]
MVMPRGVQQQRGGTTAGLIIGLIIGLLIAVGIAMTIMKTPLPFIDKIGKPSQSAGDLGDPNKSLQGSTRDARDAESNADLKTPAAPPPVAEPKRPSAPAPAPRPSEKPATAASPDTAPSASGAGFTYYLQAGAFRERQDAEATKARLALMGVAATIAERKSEMGTLYRVRVGPFDDVEGMNRARVRLSDNGVDAAVVRVPK